jgi:hypothetical protein
MTIAVDQYDTHDRVGLGSRRLEDDPAAEAVSDEHGLGRIVPSEQARHVESAGLHVEAIDDVARGPMAAKIACHHLVGGLEVRALVAPVGGIGAPAVNEQQ